LVENFSECHISNLTPKQQQTICTHWHKFLVKLLLTNSFMPSSVVASFEYDASTSTLRVTYVSGVVYDYKNVPEEVYAAMKTSFSKGTFLNHYIKGKYAYEKISDK